MRKLILIFTLLFSVLTVHAEDNKIEVSASQTGAMFVKTTSNSFSLYKENIDNFTKMLKSHNDFLTKIANEKINVKKVALTGTFVAGITVKLDCRIYLNSYKEIPYLFEITFDNDSKETVIFTVESLNQFIKNVENIKLLINNYNEQFKKIDELLKSIEFN